RVVVSARAASAARHTRCRKASIMRYLEERSPCQLVGDRGRGVVRRHAGRCREECPWGTSRQGAVSRREIQGGIRGRAPRARGGAGGGGGGWGRGRVGGGMGLSRWGVRCKGFRWGNQSDSLPRGSPQSRRESARGALRSGDEVQLRRKTPDPPPLFRPCPYPGS